MADATLIVGLAGIAGTLAAGGIGSAVTVRLEERREYRDRRRMAINVLRAVRLIDEEMAWSAHALARAASIEDWWTSGAGPRLEAWEEHAPTAAGDLSPGNWSTLAAATIKIRRIIAMRADLEAHGSRWPDLPWTDELREQFLAAATAIRDARILLRPVNLGGTTFPEHEGGFWFPAVPELVPEELWDVRRQRAWERRRKRLQTTGSTGTPGDDDAVTMVPN